MIRYRVTQNKNKTSKAYGKYYAQPVIEETVDLSGLATHMSEHNTPFSEGVIKGLLTDMVGCIKELMLEGKNVKIDGLAIFSVGIRNKAGALSEEEFTPSENIKGVKFRARATGELISKTLTTEASLRKVSATAAAANSSTQG